MLEMNEFQRQIFKSKYANNGEEWEDSCDRIARFLSEAEVYDKKSETYNYFKNTIVNGDFIPGGRVLRNAGLPKPTMLNCFVLDVEDDINSIGKLLSDVYTVSCNHGGIGINFSNIRPKGDILRGVDVSAPGSMSNMQMIDKIGEFVECGGARRVALLAALDIKHPDLIEFLHKKLDLNQLNNFNISVIITDEFLDAVKKDKEWIFEFNGRKWYKYKVKIKTWGKVIEKFITARNDEHAIRIANQFYREKSNDEIQSVKKIDLKASDLLKLLVANAHACGEPGIIHIDHMNNMSTSSYFNTIRATNPCIVGDTMIATADGRNAVPIKQLSEEGNDIPVYCIDNNGKTTIRMMRNPRITGYNEDIYEVKLDDGSSIKCTGNHKFRLKDGTYKEAKDLNNEESLEITTKFKAKWKEIISNCNSESQSYWFLNDNKPTAEHRMIYEFHNGKIKIGNVIHHVDFDASNNNIDNLKLMSKEEHDVYHDISGDKNPMRKWYPNASKEEKERYHKNMSESTSGFKNGNSNDITNEDLFNIMIEKIKKDEKPLSVPEWRKFAKKKGYPQKFTNFRGSLSDFINSANHECVYETKSGNSIFNRQYIKYIDIKKHTDLDVRLIDNCILVYKNCEGCGKEIIHPWSSREVCFCQKCACYKASKSAVSVVKNKWKNIRENKRKTFIDHFTKIVSEKNEIPKINEFDIDFRTIGHKSYQDFLNCFSDDYGIDRISLKKLRYNKNDYSFEKANELKERGLCYNHKVVSVTYIGKETVYNGTVDDFHNFNIIVNQNNIGKYNHKLFMINNLQCGEVPLPANGCCCLGSINLSNMWKDDTGKLNTRKLRKTIKTAVRMLDNVLTLNQYPLVDIKEESQRSRRIGLGVMGLSYLVIKAGHKYGSESMIEFTDELFKTIRNEAYKASIELAKEKGTFPAFDLHKYIEQPFIKSLPPTILTQIKKHGIRNGGILSIAPTGTISMVAGVSSGIEPIYSPMYKRTFRKDGVKHEEIVTDKLFSQYILEGKDLENFVGAMDVTPENHIAVQATIQQHVDLSISKTINLPANYPLDEIYNNLIEYIEYCKGFTIYRSGSRGEEPLQMIDIKSMKQEELLELVNKSQQKTDEKTCKNGVCEL